MPGGLMAGASQVSFHPAFLNSVANSSLLRSRPPMVQTHCSKRQRFAEQFGLIHDRQPNRNLAPSSFEGGI